MKCPLIEVGRYHDGKDEQVILSDCFKEECAWWDSAREMCREASLHLEIALLTKVLLDIKEKMPHAEQFTK